MSHYKVKSIRIDRKSGQIWLRAADSSIRPLEFCCWEYCGKTETLSEKLEHLFIDILDGNLVLYAGNRWQKVAAGLEDHYQRIAGNTDLFLMDHIYRTEYGWKLKHYLANAYGVSVIMNGKTNPDPIYEQTFVTACQYAWEREDADLRRQGVLLVKAASVIPCLPGYDILYTHDHRIMVGAGSKYDNRGRFDNYQNVAVFVETKDPDKIWNLLVYRIPKSCTEKELEQYEKEYPEIKSVCALFRSRICD